MHHEADLITQYLYMPHYKVSIGLFKGINLKTNDKIVGRIMILSMIVLIMIELIIIVM